MFGLGQSKCGAPIDLN